MGEARPPANNKRGFERMLSHLLTTIARERLLVPGDRVLCAVSGGPDSTALLHGLFRLSPRLEVAVEAVTVDHGLRPESPAEARGVAAACLALGVACSITELDVRGGRQPGESLQSAARRLRLAALEAAALRRSCSRIALGHTADDQAETILFRIVRGTGLRGLAGIPYRRGPFVRPLLDVGRNEVLAYLRRRRLPFLEDPSNRDPRFARSRVRHRWLPFLAAENPRIAEALISLARQARALPDPGVNDPAGGGPSWLADPRVSRRAREVIARLAARPGGTRWVSVQDAVAEVRDGQVRFRPPPDRLARGPEGPDLATLAVAGPGSYLWPAGAGSAWTLDLRLVQRTGGGPAAPATLGREWLEQGLVLRALRPGDRMRPRGGRGSRKLQDLLVDAKIPREHRRGLPALVAGGGAGPILFVPGLRPAEEGRPGSENDPCLEVRAGQAGAL
jgi:tRNA(Ile)-lysidine synthase